MKQQPNSNILLTADEQLVVYTWQWNMAKTLLEYLTSEFAATSSS